MSVPLLLGVKVAEGLLLALPLALAVNDGVTVLDCEMVTLAVLVAVPLGETVPVKLGLKVAERLGRSALAS